MPDIKQYELRYIRLKKIMNASGQLEPEGRKSKVTIEIANYIVVFQRVIKGIPVIGPGEQIRIYLSVNGDIIGHSKIWRHIGKKISVGRVLSTNEIKRIFIKHHNRDPIEKIVVDRFYFGYFSEGRYYPQKYLKPYYIIGYTYGPYSKRVFELYDAYTGKLIKPHPEAPGTPKRFDKKFLKTFRKFEPNQYQKLR